MTALDKYIKSQRSLMDAMRENQEAMFELLQEEANRKDWISVKEAALFTGTSVSTIRARIKDGSITARRVKGSTDYQVRRSSLYESVEVGFRPGKTSAVSW